MKEIKFRAWDKIDKKMRQVILLVIMGTYKCELMQYTGLKDKNDRKIYEGYIVRYKGKNYKVCMDAYGVTIDTTTYVAKVCNELEVIGNIYENPELLEAQNE